MPRAGTDVIIGHPATVMLRHMTRDPACDRVE
jgi:hypothetical protein